MRFGNDSSKAKALLFLAAFAALFCIQCAAAFAGGNAGDEAAVNVLLLLAKLLKGRMMTIYSFRSPS